MSDKKSLSHENETASSSEVASDLPDPGDGYIYDATLTHVDEIRGVLTFEAGGAIHRVSNSYGSHFSAGAVGRLRLPTNTCPLAFHIYADQRLRRAPDQDTPVDNRWAWRIGTRIVHARAGILPGRGGQVIRQDTESLLLDLPRELVDFCQSRGLLPQTVLRAFIADLCELQNYFSCPREDGYSSSGSDERLMAMDYFQRAFSWTTEPEYRPRTRGARRKPNEGA